MSGRNPDDDTWLEDDDDDEVDDTRDRGGAREDPGDGIEWEDDDDE